jgi:N-acetylneuraminate lyase
MKFQKFEGIIPALLTPFGKDDEVNYKALGQMVNRLIEQGVGGLFVCGSTAEWWALTVEERMKIVDRVMETVAGRTRVMVHVGSTATRFSVQLARHAKRAGAHAVSALPPVGGKYSNEQIWNHFQIIAQATDLPLYLYHLPQLYGELITVDKFIEATQTMPTLAGAKFSSYRIDDMIDLRIKAKGRLNIISGCGEQLLSATACGADGSICTWYNYIPRLGNKIIECVRNNDVAGARRCEEILVEFAMLVIGKHIGNMKWLITLRGIDVGVPRLPLTAPTEDEKRKLLPKIEATGIFDWCV